MSFFDNKERPDPFKMDSISDDFWGRNLRISSPTEKIDIYKVWWVCM